MGSSRQARGIGVWLLLAVALGPPTARAGNLVPNPDLDTSLLGWLSTSLDLTATWDALDVDGRQDSGSARLASAAPCTGGCSFAQVGLRSSCFPLGEGAYDLSGWILVPLAQPRDVRGFLVVDWFSSPNCLDLVNRILTSSVTAQTGDWELVEATGFQVPATAVSGRVRMEMDLLPGTAEGVLFFDRIFVPEPKATALELAAMLGLSVLHGARRRRGGQRVARERGAARVGRYAPRGGRSGPGGRSLPLGGGARSHPRARAV